MGESTKSFGFRRNVDYIKVNLFLMWRTVMEYKTNFWSSIIIQVFFLGTYVLFFEAMTRNFGDIIGWNIWDFLLFLVLVDTIWVLSGVVFWSKSLFHSIISGELNNYLMRPINIFLGFNFSRLDIGGLVMFAMNFVYILYYIVSQDVSLFSLALGVFIMSLIVLVLLLFIWFVESLNFFYKGLSMGINEIIGNFVGIAQNYPYQYFKSFEYKLLLFFFPIFFVSSLVIPIFKGDSISNIGLQLSILGGFIVFYSFFTFLFWKLGIRRYEAFG